MTPFASYRSSVSFLVAVAAVLTIQNNWLRAADSEKEAFFESKNRPVLHETCDKCHGPQKSSSGLRLDSRDAILSGGDRGPALVVGDPQKSPLIQSIKKCRQDVKMPPKETLPEAVGANFE